MQCSRCHREITEDQTYLHQGKAFCDDCLMDIGLSIRECDPWATYVDNRARKRAGLQGAEGLTDMEAQVYSLVQSHGRISREEVMEHLGISETDLTFHLVPLMHFDMVKEVGEGDRMLLITPS